MDDDTTVTNKKYLTSIIAVTVIVLYFILKKLTKKPNPNKQINQTQTLEEFESFIKKEKERKINSKGKKSLIMHINKDYFNKFEQLSQILLCLFNMKYEIHLIIKVAENENQENYISLFSTLIQNEIIKKHVRSNNFIY